jgi:hypothetical protein
VQGGCETNCEQVYGVHAAAGVGAGVAATNTTQASKQAIFILCVLVCGRSVWRRSPENLLLLFTTISELVRVSEMKRGQGAAQRGVTPGFFCF